MASYYSCKMCDTEIEFAYVEALAARDSDGGVGLDIVYTCGCTVSKGEAIQVYYKYHKGAYRRMVQGFNPILPYRASPGRADSLPQREENIVALFHLLCLRLRGVDHFLELCQGAGEADQAPGNDG